MTPNAFIGKPKSPHRKKSPVPLGPSAETWQQLLDWPAHQQGVALEEWKCTSPKYGWSLRRKLKKRTIVHLSRCDSCFRVALILGDCAVKAARQSDLPKPVLKVVHDAPLYAEGTGVRLEVNKPADLGAISKPALIKLAN
jgi:hypothetical protein